MFVPTGRFAEEVTSASQRRIAVIVGSITALLAIGGGVAYAYAYFAFFKEEPIVILERMLSKYPDVKSSRNTLLFNADLAIVIENRSYYPASVPSSERPLDSAPGGGEVSQTDTVKLKAHGDIKSAYNFRNMKDPKLDATVSVSANGEQRASKAEFRGGFDVRLLNKILYARLNELYYSEGVGSIEEMVKEYIGKWAYLDFAKLAEYPEVGGSYGKQYEATLEAREKEAARQRTVLENFRRGIAYTQFVQRSLAHEGSETVDGARTHHLQLKASKEAWKALLKALDDAEREATRSSSYGSYSFARNEESLEYAADVLSHLVLDLYIGKSNDYLHKLQSTFTFTQTKFDAITLDGTITLTVGATEHNQDISIEVPQPLEINILEMVEASFGEARKRSRDAKHIADVRNIQLALELYYDDHKASYPSSLADLVPEYLPNASKDPLSGTATGLSPCRPMCCYAYRADGKMYHLGVSLEDPEHYFLSIQEDADFNSVTARYRGSPFNGAAELIYDTIPVF